MVSPDHLLGVGSAVRRVEGKTARKVDAYTEGKLAWEDQLPRGRNPHEPGTLEHVKWDEGWLHARDKAAEG
jgi:hypothetical protein